MIVFNQFFQRSGKSCQTCNLRRYDDLRRLTVGSLFEGVQTLQSDDLLIRLRIDQHLNSVCGRLLYHTDSFSLTFRFSDRGLFFSLRFQNRRLLVGLRLQDDRFLLSFRDENGDLFDVVTWYYNASSDGNDQDEEGLFNASDEDGDVDLNGLKLDSSVGYFKVYAGTYDYFDDADEDYFTNVYFTLETSSDIYETKEYDVVVRTEVYETDPKGIYFEESSITLDIGESYTPNVLGVATGRTVDAVIEPGTGTSRNVIDIEDDDTIIGTQEGTAYVTATYEFIAEGGYLEEYTSSSMKVTVTDEVYDGESEEDTDDDATSTYMVTASTLNVRTGPSTSYSKASYQLTSGELVEVVSVANGWAQLSDGNYVSAQYLMEVTTSDDGSATTMYVTCRTLNVRTGPSTSYSKVGTLSRGTSVEVVGTYGNWAKLSNGYYVSLSYLSA